MVEVLKFQVLWGSFALRNGPFVTPAYECKLNSWKLIQYVNMILKIVEVYVP